MTTTADAGPGSLRQALAEASDGASIDFAVTTPATIALTSGELVVARSVTIAGPGAASLRIDAGGAARTLHVSPSTTVTLSGLTLAGGFVDQGGGCLWNENGSVTLQRVVVTGCTARYGGGILNDGENAPATMHIVETTVAANQTTTASGVGIYNDGSGTTGNATLDVERSTISGNHTSDGGGAGIYNDAFDLGRAILSVHGSTISGNSGTENGGGVTNGGFNGGHATLSISNSTFAGNAAPDGGAVYNKATGGGIAELAIGNTILQAGASGGTLTNVAGTVTSAGFNLASDAAGGDAGTAPGGLLSAASDRRNTEPALGGLAANGGPTATHALSTGSPAIDQGRRDTIAGLVDATDQRGFLRPVDVAVANPAGGDGSDVGAFEVQRPHDLAVTALQAPARITLRSGGAAVVRVVRVVVQNRSAVAERIADRTALAGLVGLEATSLGSTCVAPAATVVAGKANRVPRDVKPKKSFAVAFSVAFDCANDPQAAKDPAHADFRWTVTLDRTALDGVPDDHAADDVCPHPAPSDGKDTRPDLKRPIKDRGCGGKLAGGTRGADVTTDVVVK